MKNVLITGATGDIGSALARKFAQNGYAVIIHYNSNREKAEELQREIGGKTVKADISNKEETERMFEEINAFGGADTVINNAGTQLIKMLCDTEFDEMKSILDTDLLGACNVCRCAVNKMMWTGGNIINISSVWGQCGGACESVYSAAKSGLIGLTKALAKEYGNIRTNCICPGVIEGKMNEHLSEEERKILIDCIPAGRFGKSEEVAELALFLDSDKAEYITGQVIAVNGGMYI